jgi:ribosomal protein L11 methyltransferase
MALLEKYLHPGDRVLDMGTGSGILAITAVRLNAGSVTAFDVDAVALVNAAENAALNGVSGLIRFYCGSLAGLRHVPHEIIVANIDTPALAPVLPEYGAYLTAGGRLILSGILESEAERILSVLKTNGYRVEETAKKGEWAGISAVRYSNGPEHSRPSPPGPPSAGPP